MKTQIETTLRLTDICNNDSLIADEFNYILEGCLLCKNKDELSSYFESGMDLKYFIKGFGSNHFWCKQTNSDNRVLFIDFLNQ